MKSRTLMAALAVALGTTALAVPAFADREQMRGMMHGMMGAGGPHGMIPDFATLDADGDGSVTEAELLAWRQGRVTGIDADGDGLLSTEELVAHEMRQAQASIEARVARRVASQDLDGDGALSAEELMAPPMPMQLFGRVDADGDGAVTTEEFEAAKARMAERMRDHGGRGDRDDRGKGKERDGKGRHGERDGGRYGERGHGSPEAREGRGAMGGAGMTDAPRAAPQSGPGAAPGAPGAVPPLTPAPRETAPGTAPEAGN